jgi:hypothetical protein
MLSQGAWSKTDWIPFGYDYVIHIVLPEILEFSMLDSEDTVKIEKKLTWLNSHDIYCIYICTKIVTQQALINLVASIQDT